MLHRRFCCKLSVARLRSVLQLTLGAAGRIQKSADVCPVTHIKDSSARRILC
jgi:hypothetical protein